MRSGRWRSMSFLKARKSHSASGIPSHPCCQKSFNKAVPLQLVDLLQNPFPFQAHGRWPLNQTSYRSISLFPCTPHFQEFHQETSSLLHHPCAKCRTGRQWDNKGKRWQLKPQMLFAGSKDVRGQKAASSSLKVNSFLHPVQQCLQHRARCIQWSILLPQNVDKIKTSAGSRAVRNPSSLLLRLASAEVWKSKQTRQGSWSCDFTAIHCKSSRH